MVLRLIFYKIPPSLKFLFSYSERNCFSEPIRLAYNNSMSLTNVQVIFAMSVKDKQIFITVTLRYYIFYVIMLYSFNLVSYGLRFYSGFLPLSIASYSDSSCHISTLRLSNMYMYIIVCTNLSFTSDYYSHQLNNTSPR